MNQPVLAGCDFHKCAEGHQSCDSPLINRAGFGIGNDCGNHILCHLDTCGVNALDVDDAVILCIDFTAGFLHNLLDDLTSCADNLSNFFHINLHLCNLRCIRRKLFSGLCDCLQHNLIQNVISCSACLRKCLLNHREGQAVNLHIHLDGCDTLACPCNLKVHIAKEVLNALNICDFDEITIVFARYQTYGNTCNRTFDGNTCRHQGQCGAADGCLRGRTVGA